MEYMAGGDLLKFLRNVKEVHKMEASQEDPFMAKSEKLDICRQMSLGFEYLASKKVKTNKIQLNFGKW